MATFQPKLRDLVTYDPKALELLEEAFKRFREEACTIARGLCYARDRPKVTVDDLTDAIHQAKPIKEYFPRGE